MGREQKKVQHMTLSGEYGKLRGASRGERGEGGSQNSICENMRMRKPALLC